MAGTVIDKPMDHRATEQAVLDRAGTTRMTEAEQSLLNHPWDEAAVRRGQKIFDRTLTPLSDHRGSSDYRLEVSKSLIEKYWWEQRS